MVQQNYMLRLALGRSAFEPAGPRETTGDEASEALPSDQNIILSEEATQQYDDRGYPMNRESRAAARRLRHAQNNVYSTIGLLVPTNTASSQSRRNLRQAREDGRPADQPVSPRPLTDEEILELERDELEEWPYLCLSIGCDALSLTAAAFVRNHRKRIQTFRMYAGQPLIKIALTERRHQSILSYWFAGQVAMWAERTAEVALRLTVMAVPEVFNRVLAFVTGGRYPRDETDLDSPNSSRSFAARALEQGFPAVTCIALAPFSAIIALQRLQLIPANDLVPMPWQYSIKGAYLSLLPPLPLAWTIPSVLQFCGSIPTSPIGISLIMQAFFPVLAAPVSRYVRALLPRPDNPEMKETAEADTAEEPRWYLHGLSHHQSSVKDELASDLQWIGRNLTYYYYRLRSIWLPTGVRKRKGKTLVTSSNASRYQVQDLFEESQQIIRDLQNSDLTESDRNQRHARLGVIENLIAEHVRSVRDASDDSGQANRRRLQTFLEHAQSELDQTIRGLRSSSPSPPDSSGRQRGQASSESPRPANGPLNSHPVPSSTSLPSPVSSSPPSSPPLEPTNVQVRTRAGSTSTLHMDVEINRAAVDGTTFTTSFTASPRTPVIETAVSQVVTEPNNGSESAGDWKSNVRPQHRVSPLSLLPSEILGALVEQIVIQTLWLPLESLYLRKLARSYYANVMPARMAQVYPVGTWFGGPDLGRSRGWQRLTYATNILLCLGTELWIDAGCWMLASTLGVWMGKHWFQWGHL